MALALVVLGATGASCGGSSNSRSAEIGPSGGSLVGPGGVVVDVPAGAVDTTFTLVIGTLPPSRRPGATASAATGVHLEPEGQMFNRPVEVTIPIVPGNLPPGKTIDDVIVLRAQHGSSVFVPLPTRRVGNAVVCSTEHFSDFVAVVPSGDGGSPFGMCGDTMCDPTESCTTCPLDCGLCLDGGAGLDAGPIDAGGDAGPIDAGTDAAVAARFVPNGDGTVTDSTTTLQWELTPSQSLISQAAAMTYCAGLATGGHSDWRLPTVQESITLIDYTRYNPAIDPVFTTATGDYIWTSTLLASDGSSAWVMYAWGGALSSYLTSFSGALPWCVRGMDAQPAAGFTDNGDGTVTDMGTGLMWQKTPSGTGMMYAAAQSYCAALPGGPWRLPTLHEIFRITRFDRSSPAFDPIFFDAAITQNYWSSSPYVPLGELWYWMESNGGNSNGTGNFNMTARCVK